MRNNLLNKILCLLGTQLLTLVVFADFEPVAQLGGGTSGGGNVKVCLNPKDKQPTYQLLDYYDALKPDGYGFRMDLGDGQTYQEKIDYVLNRLAKYDSYRAELYRTWANNFIEETLFSLKGALATPSNDLGSGYILDPNCNIMRAFVLLSEEERLLMETDKRYKTSSFIWSNFDEETKAGMVLHELAYREAISMGAKNSLAIRRYVGLISSKNIETLDYSIEILKAGLYFWGSKLNSDSSTTDLNDLTESPTNNKIFWKIYGTKEGLWLNRSNATGRFTLKFEDQNLTCRDLSIKTQIIDRKNSLKIYRNLIGLGKENKDGNKSLALSSLQTKEGISLNGCNSLRLKSEYFKNATQSFDLDLDTEFATGFFMTNSIFVNAKIKSGKINNTDVSGLFCDLSESGQVACW